MNETTRINNLEGRSKTHLARTITTSIRRILTYRFPGSYSSQRSKNGLFTGRNCKNWEIVRNMNAKPKHNIKHKRNNNSSIYKTNNVTDTKQNIQWHSHNLTFKEKPTTENFNEKHHYLVPVLLWVQNFLLRGHWQPLEIS